MEDYYQSETTVRVNGESEHKMQSLNSASRNGEKKSAKGGRTRATLCLLPNMKTIATCCRMLAVIALLISHSTTYAQDNLNRSTCNYVSDPPAATTTHQTVSGSLPNGTTYNRYDFYLTAGRTYHFSLCSADGGGTNYDSYIGLYGTGGSSDYGCFANQSPTYFAYNDDDGCANNASRITYTATTSRWTSLYISGYGTAYGNYTLVYWYDAASSTPTNSTCATATQLPCGTSNLAGTTIGTPGTAHGTGASVSNYGVWYTFTGNGGETTISSSATFDHRIVVTKGSCGNLTLVASVDNSTGAETYTFTTENGVTYYVYIAYCGSSGTNSNTGTFTISRTCPPPPNATCADATALPCGTSNLAGTTVNTTGISHGTSASVSNYGVWYTFIGDGTQTTITSVAGSGYDHEMDIFSGSCGNLTLLAARDNGTSGGTETYTFTTVSGTTYYVYIAYWSSSGTTTGTFTISRTCPPPCENATALPCGTTNLAGTTVGSSGSPHGTGYDISNYGVWYTFVGDGNETTITTTAASGFDHEMAIVSGTCGGTFTQIADRDAGFSGGTETYTFTPTNGVTYYVYIAYYGSSGTSSNTGSFTISRICCTNRTANIPNCPGTMTSGQSLTLTGTVSAGAGTESWTTSSSGVLSLSGNTVTAGTPGTATITYTRDMNGGYCDVSATCQITVSCATNTEPFVFNTTSGTVVEDASINISGYLTIPTGATVTGYTSANTSIATVTNAGVVTGMSTGTTTITATIAQWTYNGVTYCQRTTTNSFTVTVTGGFTCESPSTSKEVGTGTEQQYTYGPVNNFWNYGIRQIIYDREDGLCAGVITGIAFNAYNGPIDDKTKVTIYMGERPTSTFSSTNDWTPSSELTKVYSGSMRFNTAGWKWFGFSQPFVYSGEGSLVVAIIDSSGAHDGSNYYFLNTNLGNGIYKQLYLQNDNNNYDINNPPTGTQGTYRPNTRFCIHCCTERTGTAGFEFCKDAAMIDIGSSAAITMPVEGADGVSPTGTVSYSSDNTSVATVSNDGTVTGVANGSATITAVMAYDDPTGYCPVVAKYNVQVGPPAPCFEIGAGSATSYFPIPGFWGNQYDVYIYTPTAATELNNNLTITSIAYDITSPNATSTSQMTIWVKDVDPATALAGGTTFATYIAGASQVYNNTSYSAPNTGWQTLDFSTPFSHTGGRALLVAVRGYGCNTSGGCSRNCRYTSATNTHWYKHNDGTDQGQSVSGNLDANRANIKLCYEATAFTPDVMPTVEITNATQPNVCWGNAITNMNVTASDDVTFSPALNTLGLNYNSSTNVISGTPNFTGSRTVTVTVTSDDGCLKSTKDLSITVNELGATIYISNP